MTQIKKSILLALLFGAAGLPAFSQTPVSLKEAVRTASGEIAARLETGAIIAVLEFRSGSASMSEYGLEEMISALANQRNITVVGRGRDLELARRELGLNLSGDISDESALAIGHFLGARMVVSGSLIQVGTAYRLGIRMLEVETGVIRYDRSQNVRDPFNFTAAERAAAASLNLAFGVGSFVIQKDNTGGAITAALEGIGVAAVVASFFLVTEKEKINPWTGLWYNEKDTSISTPVLIGGVAAYAGGALFGIYRALSYQNPTEAPSFPWNITLLPDNHGNTAVRLSYTLRF